MIVDSPDVVLVAGDDIVLIISSAKFLVILSDLSLLVLFCLRSSHANSAFAFTCLAFSIILEHFASTISSSEWFLFLRLSG